MSGTGDEGKIMVGNNSNLQDGTVVRSARSTVGTSASDTVIGNNVTIGHNAILRACSISDASLIGMDATILEGVQVHLCLRLLVCILFLSITTLAVAGVLNVFYSSMPFCLQRRLLLGERSSVFKSQHI